MSDGNFAVTNCQYSDELLLELDEDTKFLYGHGHFKFLKLTGPTQSEKTMFNLPADADIFQALDERDARIENFYLANGQGDATLDKITKSNHTKYVKTLTIELTKINSSNVFQHFTAFTTLDFDTIFYGPSNAINLIDFLNGSIESLSISCDYITRVIVDTAFSCFPKLVYLCLRGTITYNLHVSLQIQSLETVSFNSRVNMVLFQISKSS
ncbi:hypothetical protein K501DRAFT_313366 [Backusella circina FSU 941]|nr:hypothetical protein K501DRAFT_313366 [Backusella circina FSU 941]